MLTLRRRQLLQSLTASTFLSAIPGLGCSASSEEEEESLDALEERVEALLKVKKIVILMMENRSFDHYFGHLTIGNPSLKYDYTGGKPDQREGDRRVNGLTGKEWNPKTPNGKEADGVKVFHATPTLGYSIGDINHEWVECHNQWNPERVGPNAVPKKGGMNGFVLEHLRDRGAMGNEGPAYLRTCDSFPLMPDNKTVCHNGSPGGGLMCGLEAKDGSNEQKLAVCGAPDAPMAYYKREDTKVFHAFYDNFVLCDNWYSSVCGPTWPNRYYVHSGTAGAAFGTDVKRDRRDNLDTIFKVLKSSNINFYNFFSDAPLVSAMYGNDAVNFGNRNSGMAKVFEGQSVTDRLFLEVAAQAKGNTLTRGLDAVTRAAAQDDSFETRCKKGTLPPVSYIEPPYFCGDDHPPHDIQMGQAFVKSVYNMLYGNTNDANKDQASSTLLIVMYDEHGSFFDHQDPGLAFDQSSGDKDADRNFKPLGFRVPAMVVGPMVKRAHVSHTIYDHSSVLRTIYNWVQVHHDNESGLFNKDTRKLGRESTIAGGVQTDDMIKEIYAAGGSLDPLRRFSPDHPLRPLHAQRNNGVIHKPMLRVLAANDISDCLNPNYDPSRYSMPAMPQVTTTQGRVLASLEFSHGQEGFAKAYGLPQPTVRGKTEAAMTVMEHMVRLGAVDVG